VYSRWRTWLPLPRIFQERLYIVNSGLIIRLQNSHYDLYWPGTQRERAYVRGTSISSIYQTDSMVDASTVAAAVVEEDIIDVIEVDTGN
jgi:hypothetical protein